ncbi:hypothetical protein FRB90_008055, partial [Tulasnella sp. 427]
ILWEAVIHSVWERVPRLSCLFGLIPRASSGQVDVSPGSELRWAWFDMHANFIRELKLKFEGEDLSTLTALQAAWCQRLRDTGCPRLFVPSVKHLTVILPHSEEAECSVEQWALLISATLVSYNIILGDTDDTNLIPCLEALRRHAPQLRIFTFQVGFGFRLSGTLAKSLVETLHSLDNLTSLGLDFNMNFPKPFVRDILSAGHFTHLLLSWMGTERPVTTWDIPHTLVSLVLRGDHDTVLGFLQAINPSTITRLALDSSVAAYQQMVEVSRTTTLLKAMERFRNLRRLELDVKLPRTHYLLPLENQLRNLTHLALGSRTSMTLCTSKDDLAGLANLLPKIEELRLLCSDDSESDSVDAYDGAKFIPLQELELFATRCLHLRKLSLAVSVEYTSNRKRAKIQPHRALQEFDMRHSSISRSADSEREAGTIAKMFPRLEVLAYNNDDADSSSDDSETDGWGDMVNALRRLLPGLEVLASNDHGGTLGSFFSETV